MEQLKKYRYTLILLAVALMLCQSSCRLFKKKCDCPKWSSHTKKITDGLIAKFISAFIRIFIFRTKNFSCIFNQTDFNHIHITLN